MRATLYNFLKKSFSYNKQKEIYNFGIENDTPEKIDLLSAMIAMANTNKTVAQSLFTKIRSDNCIMFIPQK